MNLSAGETLAVVVCFKPWAKVRKMSSRTSTLRPKRKAAGRSSGDSKHQSEADDFSRPAASSAGSIAAHAAYLQALSENNPLGIVVLDVNGTVQMCNPAFERLFGYQMSEIAGVKLDSVLAPPNLVAEAAEFTARTAGEVTRATTQRRRRDGLLLDVHIIGVPLVVGGKQLGSFAMYEDISERRRAEEARRQAEEKFRSLFENAVEGIFQTTVDGRYLSVNPALSRMCGYSSPEEMMAEVRDVGRTVYADPQCREEFKRLIQERGVIEGFEYQIRRKDGAKIWISENAHAVRDDGRRIVSYEGTVEDISERKRSELERQVTTEIIHSVNITDNLDDLLKMIHGALRKVLVRGKLLRCAV